MHSKQTTSFLQLIPILFVFFAAVLYGVVTVHAATVNELKQKIDSRTGDIQQLEEEIKQYEQQLEQVGKEKQTLSSAIKTLDITKNKLQTDIAVTNKKINSTNLTIDQLSVEIANKEEEIKRGSEALADSMRKINETENVSLVELVFSNDSLSTFLEDVDNLQRIQELMRARLKELAQLKAEFEAKVAENKRQKGDLLAYTSKLADQKEIVQQNQNEKNVLLTQTKNKESNYKSILEEKKAKKEAFEQELLDYEAQLRIAIDPNQLPPVGSAVLSWPLDKVHITQYFGNTAFAQGGAYKGKGHNGVDFGTPTGTPIKAAASGTIKATGNTDSVKGCYSYGKWVLIEHENGLSSLYAHLSLIKVSPGDIVERGQVVAYSGNTGYSTGPHLHFTVYASQGVVVKKFTNSINCKNATVPIAPLDAYLNPLNYLPQL